MTTEQAQAKADQAEDQRIDNWTAHVEMFAAVKSAQDRLTRCNSRSRAGRLAAAAEGVMVAKAALLDEQRFLLGLGRSIREEEEIYQLLREAYRRLEDLEQ